MGKQLCVMIFLLYEVFEKIFGNVIQPEPLLSVPEGKTVILPCLIEKKQISVAAWYKQVTGEEPRLLISSLIQSSENSFHNGFDRNHFNVLRGIDSFNLTIVNTVQSDSATYFCATSFSNIISFGNGTRLIITGAEIKPEFELFESEGNAPLQCSTQTVKGGGEHRIYWFSHGSGESPPGSVSVHGNRSDCAESSESDCVSPTCVYNLPKKSSSPSEAGAHLCALATCGHALFGNVSKLTHDRHNSNMNMLYIQIALAALLLLSLTINVLLCSLWKNRGKNQQTQTADENNIDDVPINQNREMIYATVKTFAKQPRVKRQSEQEDTLYAGLACHQQT